MGKIRSKKNPFWERHISHLPDGVEECLAAFPASAFASLELDHGSHKTPLLNCEIVSDTIQQWVIQYDEKANEKNLATKKILGDLLDFNGSPDPFLYAAVFFELTCWLRVSAFSQLDMSVNSDEEPETIGDDLGKFIDAYDTFWSDSINVLDKLIDWSHVGFSHEVYTHVVKEINRIEKIMEQFKFYFPDASKVRIFKDAQFDSIDPAPLDRKTFHRAVLYYNLFRLLRISTNESDTKLYLFMSCLPNSMSASAIKKSIQRISENKTVCSWFEQRYKRIARSSLKRLSHRYLWQLAKSLRLSK